MRLSAATLGLMLLAVPALAQRVDTRRVNVTDDAGDMICGFKAYPAVSLYHDKVGSYTDAMLEFESAPGADGRTTRLTLFIRPSGGDWRQPRVTNLLFAVREIDAPGFPRPILRAIVDDGEPIALDTTWMIVDNRVRYAVQRELDPLGHLLIRSRTLRLDLVDAAGNTLRQFRWDLRELEGSVEVLSIVKWRCDGP